MSARYVTRPLSDRTWFRPHSARTGSPFRASWTDTLELLGREVDALRGRDLVIEVDVRESDLRLDGMIRANARASSPATAVAFDTPKHGPLLYRCDRYVSVYYSQPDDWQQNVRAIALTLEKLRAVDRYGATSSGEQYRGFRQIEAAPAPSTAGTDVAWAVIIDAAYRGKVAPEARDTLDLSRTIERARRNAHPDLNGGDHALWDAVEAAVRKVQP